MTLAPSGEQLEIARGGQRACIVEVGGGDPQLLGRLARCAGALWRCTIYATGDTAPC